MTEELRLQHKVEALERQVTALQRHLASVIRQVRMQDAFDAYVDEILCDTRSSLFDTDRRAWLNDVHAIVADWDPWAPLPGHKRILELVLQRRAERRAVSRLTPAEVLTTPGGQDASQTSDACKTEES